MPPAKPSDWTLLPMTSPPGDQPFWARQKISLPDKPLIIMVDKP